jgi:hypothetical protein
MMQPGFKKIDCHMVFDVVYSSIVSRDSVHLAFLIAALIDLEIVLADVQNAYLNAWLRVWSSAKGRMVGQ